MAPRARGWCTVAIVEGFSHAIVALAGVFCLAGLVRPCHAAQEETGTFTLTWDAPGECPSREQVQREIARLLGGTTRITRGGDLEAQALVEHGALWSVGLTTRQAGRTGRRSIESTSCQSVADATALIIALIIDPDAVAANTLDGKETPTSPATPAPAPPPIAARSIDFLASVHGQASTGTLPGMDVGVGAGVGLAGQRWLWELRGTYGLRRDQVAYLSSLPGAYGRFNIYAGTLAGCLRFGPSAFSLGPCAVAEGGLVTAEGYGASVGFSKRAPWAAAGAGAYLAFALGKHVQALLRVDVLAALWRPEYVFQDVSGVIFQAPAVGGRGLASIGWRF